MTVDTTKLPWTIVIAERGWVFVGRVVRDADMTVIHNAQNIRRWGTSKGLGELAIEGPKSETILDPYGTVKIHVMAVVGYVSCDDVVWNAWLDKQTQKESKAKRK